MRPIIGITSNTMNVHQSGEDFGFKVNYTARSVIKAVESAGGIPIIIPLTRDKDISEYIDLFDGLLLVGGQDISPHLYGEEPRQVMGQVSPDRDAHEMRLIKATIEAGKPILGLCRGMQLINVIFGGSLYQYLSENNKITVQHVQRTMATYTTHSISIAADSYLARVMGQTSRINSFHHQAIKQLGDNLEAVAWSSDNVIEAIESKDKNIVAVQWHPELTAPFDDDSLSLFKDLVERAKI